jgi:hypothetical protein
MAPTLTSPVAILLSSSINIGTWVKESAFEDSDSPFWNWLAEQSRAFAEWINQPRKRPLLKSRDLIHLIVLLLEIWVLVLVWFITFWVALLIPLTLGFGPAGVLGGLFPPSTLHIFLTSS